MDGLASLIASRTSQPDHHPRPVLWGLILGAMVLLAVAVSVFGTDAPVASDTTLSVTPHREVRVYTVHYRFGIFSPTNLRIRTGDTVRFHNHTGTPVRIIADHQVGGVPVFDSIGEIQPDGYFSYTFAMAGVFGYHSEADPNQAGVIIVRE